MLVALSACALRQNCGQATILVTPHTPANQSCLGNPIQRGIDLAIPGDTVLVTEGEYYGAFNLNGKSITVRSQSGPPAAIVYGTGIMEQGEGPTARIQGFSFRIGTPLCDAGVSCGSTTGSVVDCIFADGESLNCSSGSPRILDCTFQNAAGSTVSNGAMPVIERCRISGFQSIFNSYAITVDGQSVARFVNCLFTDNTSPTQDGAALRIEGASSAALVHCTLARNIALTGPAMSLSIDSTATLRNCIVWANTSITGGTAVAGGEPNGVDIAFSNVQGGWPGTGILVADPLFRNPLLGDFRLIESSPCRDAGSTSLPSPPLTDISLSPRTLGVGPDLGCYEIVREFPGTGDDLAMSIKIDGIASGAAIAAVSAPALISVSITSPLGTFAFAPFFFVAQSFPHIQYPVGITPAIHVDPLSPAFAILIGPGLGPLGVPLLLPTGFDALYSLLPGLAGMSILIQAAVLSPVALNGVFATTDAHEIYILQ